MTHVLLVMHLREHYLPYLHAQNPASALMSSCQQPLLLYTADSGWPL